VDARQIALVQQGIIGHCELLADRFGVLDPLPGVVLFGDANTAGVDQQRPGLDSARGYAALYYPWVRVEHAGGGKPVLVPPSGHVCGHIAWTDINRGVFKAPAGIEATVNGAVEVETNMSNIDQGQLNLLGVNVIRVFKTGSRPVIWGARTTATGVDSNWQYVNIRRLFLYLEKSIQQGIRWAVFEPNNYSLWQRLKHTISEFLRQEWRNGALFGKKESEAFYVRIDDVLNPFTEQQLGRLHIEIGVRPSYPAEFIIVRIGIWDGGQQIEELT
jgi:phage tail sheath protein FI